MATSDSDSEGSRPVPGQGFGDLATYPLPTCPNDAYQPVGDWQSGTVNEMGIAKTGEVANPTTINGYGIAQ